MCVNIVKLNAKFIDYFTRFYFKISIFQSILKNKNYYYKNISLKEVRILKFVIKTANAAVIE